MFYQLRAVMQKEFAGYFRTPTAYIIIAVYLVLSMFATFYSAYFFAYDNSGLISFFTYQPEIFVVLMPAATMRLWADSAAPEQLNFCSPSRSIIPPLSWANLWPPRHSAC